MKGIYRFSPIESKEELLDAVQYVASKASELSKRVTGIEYQIVTLTVFAHYPEEYEKLREISLELGEFDHENNGVFVKLHEPINLSSGKLELLRIRKPDPYRMQVGCCDFEVGDYERFKRAYLQKNSQSLRLIERPEYEMIEFFSPDYDILAYVLSS